MNDQPREPAAPQDRPSQSQPAPATSTADDGKAGGGMRALAVLLALLLAFGAAVMIIAAGEISDTPTSEEVTSGEEPLPADGEVFDGSETKRSITTILAYASGVIGAIAVLLGIAFAITGRRGRPFAIAAIVAVALAGIALVI